MAEWTSGNIHIRPTLLPRPGQMVPGHVHPYDHTAFALSGAARVKGGSIDGDYYSPVLAFIMHRLGFDMSDNLPYVLIEAGVSHELTAIQPTKDDALAKIASLDEAAVRDLLASVMAMPSTPWCVFSLRDPQGNVLEKDIGNHLAYSGGVVDG